MNELHADLQKKKEWAQAALSHMGEQGGTGLMEASVKQLGGERLNGCGMHWSEAGATHMTAPRAQDLNGHWHQTWKTLALVA